MEGAAVRVLDASGSACYSGLSSAREKLLPAGRYTATGRVFQGGSNGLSGTPLKTTIQSFTVEKSITVTLDGAALSR